MGEPIQLSGTAKVILMLSGGRDSFLSACKILENPQKYHLLMVTFDNGCMISTGNAKLVADRIIEKYGDDRAEYLGVYSVAGMMREFFDPYFNQKTADMARDYPNLTPSQFHCLVCRTSMYIYSILLAYHHKAHIIVDGARKSQGFVVELEEMAKKRYKGLVDYASKELNFSLETILPVYTLDNDWTRDNMLLERGYLSKVFEPKCLLGFPLWDSVDQSVIDDVCAYYDKVVFPKIIELNDRNRIGDLGEPPLFSPEGVELRLQSQYVEFNTPQSPSCPCSGMPS